MKSPRPVLPNVPAGCSTNAVGSNHCSGVPVTALSGAAAGRVARAVEADARGRATATTASASGCSARTPSAAGRCASCQIADDLPAAEQRAGDARRARARTACPTSRSPPSCARRGSRRGPCCSRGCTPETPTSCRWWRRRRTSTPASCPRCVDQVYDDWNEKPPRQAPAQLDDRARRTRSRRRCSSARWSEKAGFGPRRAGREERRAVGAASSAPAR